MTDPVPLSTAPVPAKRTTRAATVAMILATVALLLLAPSASGRLAPSVEGGLLAGLQNLGQVPIMTLVYTDGFEDPGSGWDRFADESTLAEYVDGEYRLAVYGDNTMAWGNPGIGLLFSDVAIEVEARQVEGPSWQQAHSKNRG